MSQADDLLNSLSVKEPHDHVIIDSDNYFVIDPDTREIDNTSHQTNYLMQYDHESERLTFEVARYVEGHDMSLCTNVFVHFNNIEEGTDNENADIAELFDLQVNPDNEESVICSWLIGREATQLAGILSFLVQYTCKAEDGTIEYEWHSDIYSDVVVKPGRNNGDRVVAEYSSLLEQWREKLFSANDDGITNIETLAAEKLKAITEAGESQVKVVQNEGETQTNLLAAEGESQISAIKLAGEDVLNSLPEDYTTAYNMAEEALRRKADAIELKTAGESISINNASDGYLLGLKVYGKTEQNSTSGKQLFNTFVAPSSTNHDRITISDDGYTIIAEGGSTYGYTFTRYPLDLTALAGKTVTFKVDSIESKFNKTAVILYGFIDGDANEIAILKPTEPKVTAVVPDNIAELFVYVYTNTSGIVLEEPDKCTIKGLMLSYEDVPWEPYTGEKASPNIEYPQEMESVKNPTVGILGNNLADVCNMEIYANNSLAVSDDGYTIIASGGSDKPYTSSIVEMDVNLLRGKKVFLKADKIINTNPLSNGNVQMNIMSPDKTLYLPISSNELEKEIDISNDTTKIVLSVYTNNTGEALNEDNTITVEGLGIYVSSHFGWESYKDVQMFTLFTTLHGIKVKSDGNYTDSNGQMWVADYVDCEVKELVQMVKRDSVSLIDGGYLSNGNYYAVMNTPDKVYNNGGVLCDCASLYVSTIGYAPGMFYENPMNIVFIGTADDTIDTMREHYANATVQYVLAEPIVAKLTDEEVEAYKLLHTNYFNTTVINSANAYMEVEYSADTLIYLRDNQPKPTDEQVNNVVNEYLDQNGIQVPSDDHIRSLINEALGVVADGSY